MRGVKTKSEIKKIKKACQTTDKIFASAMKNFKFKTEKELEQFLYGEMKKHKVQPSFPVIVAGGAGASEPHHIPGDDKLKGFVVIDFGVIYKKYMSDMTRTIYVGKPSKKEEDLYKKVLETQIKSIEMVKDAVSCASVDRFARENLGRHKKEFIHTLGHGLGKIIHEFPMIFFKSRFYLKENMAITIEPGVYRKGKYGIRIEDTLIVTRSGSEILTQSPKSLIVVK